MCIGVTELSDLSHSQQKKEPCREAAGLGLLPTLPNAPCIHHLLPEGSSSSANATAPAERDASLQTPVSPHQWGVPAPISIDQDLRQPGSESGLSLENCSAFPDTNAHGELNRWAGFADRNRVLCTPCIKDSHIQAAEFEAECYLGVLAAFQHTEVFLLHRWGQVSELDVVILCFAGTMGTEGILETPRMWTRLFCIKTQITIEAKENIYALLSVQHCTDWDSLDFIPSQMSSSAWSCHLSVRQCIAIYLASCYQ